MNLNKTVGLVLALSLAFLAGQFFSGSGGFSIPDFGGVIPIVEPKVNGEGWLVMVDELSDPLTVTVDAARNMEWQEKLTSKEIKFARYDDDDAVAESYVKALSEKVPGVLLMEDEADGRKVVATKALTKDDTLSSITAFVDAHTK
ncbi:MAG: hypothetical protein CMK32_09985 [Porticoccaceae bacterium]|nr:hypothetical protein [Porticoccaceae bacterium]